MAKPRMMRAAPSGHTEFDDMLLLAKQCTDDVVMRRVMERLEDEIRRLERELAQAGKDVQALAGEQCRAERGREEAEAVLRRIRITAEGVIDGRHENLSIRGFSELVRNAVNNYFEACE